MMVAFRTATAFRRCPRRRSLSSLKKLLLTGAAAVFCLLGSVVFGDAERGREPRLRGDSHRDLTTATEAEENTQGDDSIDYTEEGIVVSEDRRLSSPSDRWYVDWQSHQCVKNCNETQDGNPSCGGRVSLPEDKMFEFPRQCCNEMLSWLPHGKCIRNFGGVRTKVARAHSTRQQGASECPDPYRQDADYSELDTVASNGKVYQCKAGPSWQWCNQFPPDYEVHGSGEVVHRTEDDLGWALIGVCGNGDKYWNGTEKTAVKTTVTATMVRDKTEDRRHENYGATDYTEDGSSYKEVRTAATRGGGTVKRDRKRNMNRKRNWNRFEENDRVEGITVRDGITKRNRDISKNGNGDKEKQRKKRRDDQEDKTRSSWEPVDTTTNREKARIIRNRDGGRMKNKDTQIKKRKDGAERNVDSSTNYEVANMTTNHKETTKVVKTTTDYKKRRSNINPDRSEVKNKKKNQRHKTRQGDEEYNASGSRSYEEVKTLSLRGGTVDGGHDQNENGNVKENRLFTLQVAEDVYVDHRHPDYEYDEGTLQYDGDGIEAFVRFDLTRELFDGICFLARATLRLHPLERCIGGTNVEVLVNGEGGPESAWPGPPSPIGEDAWFQVDVTNAVSWSARVRRKDTIAFRLNAADDDGSCVLASADYRKGRYAPTLELELRPEDEKRRQAPSGWTKETQNFRYGPQGQYSEDHEKDYVQYSRLSGNTRAYSAGTRAHGYNKKHTENQREQTPREGTAWTSRDDAISIATTSTEVTTTDATTTDATSGREGDSCYIGEGECDGDLVCINPDGSTSSWGACTRVYNFAGRDQLCDTFFGANACEDAGYECIGTNSFLLRGAGTRMGNCVPSSKGEGDPCQIEHYLDRENECDNDLVCYNPDGSTFGLGTCIRVYEFAESDQLCDTSFGPNACGDANYECLGANGGTNIGTCGLSSKREGDLCRIERYLDDERECSDDLVCYDPGGARFGPGTCRRVIYEFAGRDKPCAASFGAKACADADQECLGAGGLKLEGEGAIGTCGLPSKREGDPCRVERYLYGERECVNDLVCYASGGITYGSGTCTRIYELAGKDQLCDASFGARACGDTDNECIGPDGTNLAGSGTGVCTRSHTEHRPQQAWGYSSFRNANREDWFVDYSLGSEGQCVRRCEGGAHCGGLATKWDEKFIDAEECCEQKLWWMNRDECVPGL